MSSSEQEQIRAMAERLARRLASSAGGTDAGAVGDDLSAVRAGLADVRRRLAHIESHVGHDESCGPGARGPPDTGQAGAPADDPARGLELNPARGGATPATSLWLSGTYVPATEHPSQERFGIDEAVSEMVDFFEREKTCNLEPGGKPCDHCGMCSSRGF